MRQIQKISGDLASVEATFSYSIAVVAPSNNEMPQAESELQAAPDPILMAEIQQRFTTVQQALRDIISKHTD